MRLHRSLGTLKLAAHLRIVLLDTAVEVVAGLCSPLREQYSRSRASQRPPCRVVTTPGSARAAGSICFVPEQVRAPIGRRPTGGEHRATACRRETWS
jgi:hypothetical protein